MAFFIVVPYKKLIKDIVIMTLGIFIKAFTILMVITVIGCGLGLILYNFNNKSRKAIFLLNTEIHVEAHGWGAEKAAGEALNAITEIEQKLKKYSTENEIQLINTQAGVQPVAVSDLTFEVIEGFLKIALINKYAMDPIRQVNPKKVIINREQGTVYLAEKGMSLDLEVIAKEYAVNKAANILKRGNIYSALVSTGGDKCALVRD